MHTYNYKLQWEDLNKKTILGKIYTNYFLYPIIRKHIKGKLVDIGAGLGDFCKSYDNSVAADINKFAVENYKKRNLEGTLIVNDEISFKDSSFDSAILDNVIEHIYDPLPLLKEIKRILTKDGNLIIGVPGRLGFKKDRDHKVFYDKKKLTTLLRELNFEVKHFFYTPFKSDLLSDHLKIYCVSVVFNLKD